MSANSGRIVMLYDTKKICQLLDGIERNDSAQIQTTAGMLRLSV